MEKNSDFTGERYVPELFKKQENIAQMHQERYKFAAKYVSGMSVLDVACGEGYGSDMLSREARNLVGVDIDEITINSAKDKYKRDNLKFLVGGVSNIPVKNLSIDVVVSFETIEHVRLKEQIAFLEEVSRILRKDGIFIVSTPDKDVGGGGA